MNEFTQTARRILMNTAIVTGVYVILWAVLPSLRHLFAGLALGSVVSLYFVVSLMRQTQMVADIALKQVRKRPSILMANRIAVLVGAILLAHLLEPKIGYVSPLGLLVGCFTNQFVSLGGFLYKKLTTS